MKILYLASLNINVIWRDYDQSYFFQERWKARPAPELFAVCCILPSVSIERNPRWQLGLQEILFVPFF